MMQISDSFRVAPEHMRPSDDPVACEILRAFQRKAYDAAGPDYFRDRDPEAKLAFVLQHPLLALKEDAEEFKAFMRKYYKLFIELLATTEQSISNYENILQRYYLLMFKYDAVSPPNLLRPRPVLGTEPLGQVNGCVVRAEGIETPIVILDDGVFAFAHLSSKVLAPYLASIAQPTPDGTGLIWPSVLNPAVIPRQISPISVRRCVEMFRGLVVSGNPYRSPLYYADKEWANIAAFMRDAGEMFIVGHELGHISMRHKGDKSG